MRSALPVVLGWLLSASPAAGQDAAVARVLSATSTSATTAEADMQVVKGALFTNATVDVLGPSGKVEATLTFPRGVEMVLKGDRIKVTLVTKRPFPLASALVAEAGAFLDYAAALKAVSGSSPAAAPPPSPASAPARSRNVPPCPYTPAELLRDLGLNLRAGVAQTVPLRGGTSLSCRYEPSQAGAPSLTLNQIVMEDPADATPDAYFKRLAGRLQPVPNDPDKAMWQDDQGDLTNATLHYARNGVIVELRVSVGPRDPLFQGLRQRLASLRRTP